MKDEIAAAVVFLARLVNLRRNFSPEQTAEFSKNLAEALIEKFRNHWYEEKPSKGQAFRCIRIASDVPRDTVLVKAAKKSGLDLEKMNLPSDFTLWVDPSEVVCRFGEKGTICPVASFPKKTTTNDNEATSPSSPSTVPTSDSNGNVEVNANTKSVLTSITEVLKKNSAAVNDNAAASTVITTHRRGRRNRAKYNLVRNARNAADNNNGSSSSSSNHHSSGGSSQDWPALPHATSNQYHWVNKSLAAKA